MSDVPTRQVDDTDDVVVQTVDEPVVKVWPWLTTRRLAVFVVVWLGAFALGSVAVSNPFASEPRAGVAPDYWRVMYMHGLLIASVGLGALVLLDVFELRTSHVRIGIALGVVAATVLAGLGGIWNSKVPGAEVAMWTQIAGFFALDEILIMLVLGFALAWRARSRLSRSLPFVSAWLAAASMLIAALMGHLAGWILEFGNEPRLIGRYASFIGTDVATFRDNLIDSHSHDIAVAFMAVVVAAAVQRFGYLRADGAVRAVCRFGMAMVAVGVVAMTAVFVATAATTWEVPTLFQSAGGTNGVAGDDLVMGVLVMGGGLLALWPVVVSGLRRVRSWVASPLALAAAWAWTGVVAGVVIAGYWLELHETFFGAGDPQAPGAAKDAVFTWLHQDIGLFVFPTLVVLLLLADRLAERHYQGLIGWSALAGTTLLVAGGGIWVFVDPGLHGPGYYVSTAGIALVALSTLVLVVAALLGDEKLRLAIHPRRHHGPSGLVSQPHD